jgi:hypothetical protein
MPVPEQCVWVSVFGGAAASAPEDGHGPVSAPTAESLRAQLAAEREQRQADRLAQLLGKVRCGRVDDHPPHDWTRPRLFDVAGGPVRYWCKGPGVLEGGAR